MTRSLTANSKPRASARRSPHLRFFQSSSSALFSTAYHLVFATKYRKPILSPEVRQHLHTLLGDLARERPEGLGLIGAGIEPDHVHVILTVPPSVAVARAVQRVKGRTSHDLRARFPALAHAGDALWQRGYFCRGLGDVTVPQVVAYMSRQETEGVFLPESG